MHQLIKNIEQWAEDRNLINGSTPQKQMLKLMEEFGGLCGGIARNNPEMIKDAIGDCFVVLVILRKQCKLDEELVYDIHCDNFQDYITSVISSLAQINESLGWDNITVECEISTVVGGLDYIAEYYNLNFQNCIAHAYDQIKDRRGEMRDGVWVKEEDLNEEN